MVSHLAKTKNLINFEPAPTFMKFVPLVRDNQRLGRGRILETNPYKFATGINTFLTP
jgi:hypothetical protein